MTAAAPAQLPELLESEATGDIARIYQEIRETCAVPYVSSLQRHLATRPGWLEWTWASIKPAFTSGIAQEAAWAAAAEVNAEPFPKLSAAVLQQFGVNADDTKTIDAIAETFVRASPTNLMMSGLLRLLLTGERPSGGGGDQLPATWEPPAELPTPPKMVDPLSCSPVERDILMRFGTEVAGKPFVPGLYRLLANWPVFLAHLSIVLIPRFDDAKSKTACADVLSRIDANIPAVFAKLPPLADHPSTPPEEEFPDVLAALDRYRVTSPEMIVFGTLIRQSLPTDN